MKLPESIRREDDLARPFEVSIQRARRRMGWLDWANRTARHLAWVVAIVLLVLVGLKLTLPGGVKVYWLVAGGGSVLLVLGIVTTWLERRPTMAEAALTLDAVSGTDETFLTARYLREGDKAVTGFGSVVLKQADGAARRVNTAEVRRWDVLAPLTTFGVLAACCAAVFVYVPYFDLLGRGKVAEAAKKQQVAVAKQAQKLDQLAKELAPPPVAPPGVTQPQTSGTAAAAAAIEALRRSMEDKAQPTDAKEALARLSSVTDRIEAQKKESQKQGQVGVDREAGEQRKDGQPSQTGSLERALRRGDMERAAGELERLKAMAASADRNTADNKALGEELKNLSNRIAGQAGLSGALGKMADAATKGDAKALTGAAEEAAKAMGEIGAAQAEARRLAAALEQLQGTREALSEAASADGSKSADGRQTADAGKAGAQGQNGNQGEGSGQQGQSGESGGKNGEQGSGQQGNAGQGQNGAEGQSGQGGKAGQNGQSGQNGQPGENSSAGGNQAGQSGGSQGAQGGQQGQGNQGNNGQSNSGGQRGNGESSANGNQGGQQGGASQSGGQQSGGQNGGESGSQSGGPSPGQFEVGSGGTQGSSGQSSGWQSGGSQSAQGGQSAGQQGGQSGGQQDGQSGQQGEQSGQQGQQGQGGQQSDGGSQQAGGQQSSGGSQASAGGQSGGSQQSGGGSQAGGSQSGGSQSGGQSGGSQASSGGGQSSGGASGSSGASGGSNQGGPADYGVGTTNLDQGRGAQAGATPSERNRQADGRSSNWTEDFIRLYDPKANKTAGNTERSTARLGEGQFTGSVEVKGGARRETAKTQTSRAFLDWRDTNKTAQSAETIPKGYRDFVKGYFDSIEPPAAGGSAPAPGGAK